MLKFSVISIALFALAAPLAAGPLTGIVQTRHDVEGWRLTTRHDRFTGLNTCRTVSRNTRSIVMPQAIGFRYGRNAESLLAWYRLDDGAAVAWRDELPELARIGFETDGRNVAAPTDGIVWLPMSRLANIRTITIRIAPRKRPRRFDITGLDAAMSLARSAGCRDGDFVR